MKIEYEIGGKKFSSPAQFMNEPQKMVLSQFMNSIKRLVGDVICPEHGLHPTVKFKGGRTFDKLVFEVAGCCQKLIDTVNAKLR